MPSYLSPSIWRKLPNPGWKRSTSSTLCCQYPGSSSTTRIESPWIFHPRVQSWCWEKHLPMMPKKFFSAWSRRFPCTWRRSCRSPNNREWPVWWARLSCPLRLISSLWSRRCPNATGAKRTRESGGKSRSTGSRQWGFSPAGLSSCVELNQWRIWKKPTKNWASYFTNSEGSAATDMIYMGFMLSDSIVWVVLTFSMEY